MSRVYFLSFTLFSVFVFSGCAHYAISGTMCNSVASDPHATIPSDCRRYVEELANEASRMEELEILTPGEAIEYTKEK